MTRPKRHTQASSRPRSSAEIVLFPQAAMAIRRGHPWVWRQGIQRGGEGLAAGAVVSVRDQAGMALGHGLWDPRSPIAVRVFTRADEKLDIDLIVRRIERAIERREAFIDAEATNAYRLCNGEGDRVPGLVLDRYGDVVIARLDGDILKSLLEPIANRLLPRLRDRGIRSLAKRLPRDERTTEDKTELLFGPPLPAKTVVLENGVRMVVDLARGQKTGAFLDQRENRARVRELSRGRRVLNLFSYAGGFSTAAALGGAAHVTSVDIAHAAHATAQSSMRENGLDPAKHAFVTADAFAFLEAARKRNESWDLVISDPPSFAPNEKALPRALGAYRKLHEACAAVLSPGGIFCAASCSSHVTPDAFLATLDDASLPRANLSVVAFHGAGADHPITAAFPEGRYLKFAILA